MTSDPLGRLSGAVVACRRCPRLVAWREQVPPRAAFRGEAYWRKPVPGFGDPDATVVVVGLAPAAHGANRTGRMFTGDRSGDWLYRSMWRAGFANKPDSNAADDGLELAGAWVTASVRCAPPANKPTPAERAACLGYLRDELSLLVRTRVIVALGGLACDTVSTLYGLSPKTRFGHLVERVLPDSRVLVCSFHPSQQNTFTGRLTEPMLDAVFERARALSDGDQAG
ncbi:MAG: uracil-DNA glycosylase [Acidimicrobiales bacterium]